MNYGIKELGELLEKVPNESLEALAAAVKSHRRVFVYGAGRSGLMLKAFAMRLAQADFTAYVVGETVTPAIGEGDLLVLASASGKTSSVVRYASVAKEYGAEVFAITSSADSPLAAYADGKLLVSAPTKDTAPSGSIMGTLFEQSVLLLCDAAVPMLCGDAKKMRARHANLE